MTRPEIITQIDALLNDYTDQQVAENLNRQGLRSGKGERFSARIIAHLRKDYGLQDRYSRLRERGFLTLDEVAERLSVSTTTVKIWRRHGLLRSHAYTNKPECLYELPDGEPLPTKQQGCKLRLRHRQPVADIIPKRSKEVHLDA
jgi:DNA-binding transcriptional regulator YiaG